MHCQKLAIWPIAYHFANHSNWNTARKHDFVIVKDLYEIMQFFVWTTLLWIYLYGFWNFEMLIFFLFFFIKPLMSRERGMVVEYDKKLKKNSLKNQCKINTAQLFTCFQCSIQQCVEMSICTYCMHYAAILLYIYWCVCVCLRLLFC